MKPSLNILIGAGFSYLAKLPLGNELKAKFDRDLREQLLRHSGSEWTWKEGKDSATVNNGSVGADWISYSFVLNEVLEAYKSDRGAFNDYEDFYQFIKDHSGNDNWYRPLFDRAKTKMYSELVMQSPNEFFDPIFSMPNTFLIEEIINYLIADVLWTTKTDAELLEAYRPFIEYIKTFDEVNIFTLNHDLLLERLFKISGLTYCDGFSAENSILKYQDSLLPTFKCAFDSAPIKIHKLHGSIDTFLFAHCEENVAVLTRTELYSYFKPINYQSKHYVERIDPVTNTVIQHFSADTIVPRFITGNGENKKAFIEADYMYSQLYNRFVGKMKKGKNLLIVGYSFRDEHVNDVLKLFTKTDGPKVINLNPSDVFKYDVPWIKEIKAFSELPLEQK